MANEKKQANSGLPLAIIVGVLVLVVIGGWWFYSSSANKPKTSNRNTASTQRSPSVPTNAPVGAQPPNLLGSPTASVTVEEFADFQCGSCAAAHPVLKEIQSVYGSRIKFIFRNFPLGMHDKALTRRSRPKRQDCRARTSSGQCRISCSRINPFG